MRYMLFVCSDPDRTAELERTPLSDQDMADQTESWVEEMDRRGIRKHGDILRPPADATTVRVRNGETLLTDGPFAETREQIAGYDLIECADLDEAIAVAARHPMATMGLIEVRPFLDE